MRVLYLVLVACLTACSPQRRTERILVHIAGASATNCGMVRLRGDYTSAIACATGALSSKQAFYVGFQIHGVDSEIWMGVARRENEEVHRVLFDSDIFGSDIPVLRVPRSSTQLCPAPVFPHSGFERLSCDGT